MTSLATEPVRVRAPATSANLGPGFDSLALALRLYDEVTVQIRSGPVVITVTGEGTGSVPTDESHLVVRAIRRTLEHCGSVQPGLALHCENMIPHERGLGSSAAAIVAGFRLAEGLLQASLPTAELLGLATEMEGHPDNVAACLLGGLTIAWMANDVPQAASLRIDPDIVTTAFVPEQAVSTAVARGVLPATVPHATAAANAARAALLVAALTGEPGLLLSGTCDFLHQIHRRDAMPASYALMTRLRESGHAAVISGAGPAVLVLHRRRDTEWPDVGDGWRRLSLGLDLTGARLIP